MDSEPVPHGRVYRPFIVECHDSLGEQLNEVSEFYGQFRVARPHAFGVWRMQQAGKRRSYLTDIYDWGQHDALLLVHSAYDHAWALRDSLSDPDEPRVWAYLTLARATVEACMRAAYLTDETVPPATKVLRAGGVRLDGCVEQLKLARLVREARALKGCEAELAAAVLRCERGGIVVRRDGRNRLKSLERDGEVARLGVNVSDEVEHRMADFPMAYRSGSATTHSATWFLRGAIGATDAGGYVPRPDPHVIAVAVLSTLLALQALAEATTTDVALEELQQHSRERSARVLQKFREGHPPQ